MFTKKNLLLLIFLLFLIALLKGILDSAFYQKMFTKPVNIPFSNPGYYVEVIVDVSGSMWGQLQGASKLFNSVEVLKVILNDLPHDINLGLRTFGGDDGETRLEIPPGKNNREKIYEIINKLKPGGKSPIGYALDQAGKDLSAVKGKRYIILISDGIDNGTIDPINKARELKIKGIITHVVCIGGSNNPGESQLKEIAKAGGGHFFYFSEKDLVVPTMTLP